MTEGTNEIIIAGVFQASLDSRDTQYAMGSSGTVDPSLTPWAGLG